MTNKQIENYNRMLETLKRISKYLKPEYLEKHSRKLYGLDYHETLEMSYENVIQEAKNGMKGVRKLRVDSKDH